MQHVRRLSWHPERLHHACIDLGTWGYSAQLLLGHQFVALIGLPVSASSPRLVHRSATKLNPTSSGGVTWGYSANRTLGHQFLTLIGSPVSASSPRLVHRSATKLNPTSSRMAYGSPFTVPCSLNSSLLNLSALDRSVKGAWRGYDVAPAHDT